MKKGRKILGFFCVLAVSLVLFGCNKQENVAGDLSSIMNKLYNGISDNEKPMMLTEIPIDDENFEYYTFVNDVKYKEALASESGIGSIAHSVVLIRLEDANDSDAVVDAIKKNANPAKWICVEASNVIVKAKGDLVILIMSGDLASRIENNFDNL